MVKKKILTYSIIVDPRRRRKPGGKGRGGGRIFNDPWIWQTQFPCQVGYGSQSWLDGRNVMTCKKGKGVHMSNNSDKKIFNHIQGSRNVLSRRWKIENHPRFPGDEDESFAANDPSNPQTVLREGHATTNWMHVAYMSSNVRYISSTRERGFW